MKYLPFILFTVMTNAAAPEMPDPTTATFLRPVSRPWFKSATFM